MTCWSWQIAWQNSSGLMRLPLWEKSQLPLVSKLIKANDSGVDHLFSWCRRDRKHLCWLFWSGVWNLLLEGDWWQQRPLDWSRKCEDLPDPSFCHRHSQSCIYLGVFLGGDISIASKQIDIKSRRCAPMSFFRLAAQVWSTSWMLMRSQALLDRPRQLQQNFFDFGPDKKSIAQLEPNVYVYICHCISTFLDHVLFCRVLDHSQRINAPKVGPNLYTHTCIYTVYSAYIYIHIEINTDIWIYWLVQHLHNVPQLAGTADCLHQLGTLLVTTDMIGCAKMFIDRCTCVHTHTDILL